MEIYTKEEPYIFISYARNDSGQVLPIVSHMVNDEYRIWFDRKIEVGRKWAEIVVEHLIESTCFIAFLTENYLKSDNCMDEIEYAKNKKIPIIMIYLEDLQIPEWFSMRHGRTQSIRYNEYNTQNKFFERMYESSILENCRIKERISVSDELQNEEEEKESTNMTKSVFVNKFREILKKTERDYGTINVSDDPDCDVDFGVDDKGMLILGGNVTWLPLKELEKIKYRVIPEEYEGHPMDSYICFEFKNKARVYTGIGLDYWPGEKFEFVYDDTYWGIENAKEVITADYNWYQPAEFITKGNKLVGYMGKETNIIIPNGIKVIGNNAFQNYKGVMESVKLSDTVKEIKSFAFGNPKLKSIDLNNVEIIGDHAFRASQLKQITLPKSLKVLGKEVFYFSEIKSLKCIKNESKVEVTDKHLNGESLIDV